MTTTEIEVRLRPEQWVTLANMLARAALVSDRHKTAGEQARDKVQAANMRAAVIECRNSGCAMSATLEKWQAFIRTGERLAKHSSEWTALACITQQLSPASCSEER